VSISSLAAASLQERTGAPSTAIPNVFDFDHPRPAPRLDVRRDMRAELGMGEAGALIVQPTRVVPRKGIELTIDLAARLGDPDAVVLITSPAGDEGLDYLISLERRAERGGVNLRYAADRFAPDHEGRPIGPAHSLTEAYMAADLIAYPSLYEGFGNALLEAVFFGKPVFVNRYPVYEADIRPLGLRFVEIDGVVTDEAVEAVRSILADPERQEADAEHNFVIGKAQLGYDRLERGLAQLLASLP
jgi:glycosyltransferase involved in cell wall biosynthesis